MSSRESILNERKHKFRAIRDDILEIKDSKVRSKKIAEWAVDVGLESPLMPPIAPPMLLDYRRKMMQPKPPIVDKSFWEEPQIVNFLREKWNVNRKNRDAFTWLHWIKRHLDPKDVGRGVLVRNRIYEFTLFFNEEPKREAPFEALKGARYADRGRTEPGNGSNATGEDEGKTGNQSSSEYIQQCFLDDINGQETKET